MTATVDEVKSEYLELENRIRSFLIDGSKCIISNAERMQVYNKIYALINQSDVESQWQAKNTSLYDFYVDRQRLFLEHWENKTSQLSGLPFLVAFSDAWDKMKIFTKFSITIFLKLNSFAIAYKNVTLLQKVLQIKREWIKRVNNKLKRALLDEFKKEREHDNCDTDLIKAAFRMYFEVDFEKHSKLSMINKKLQYGFKGETEE